MGSQFLSMIRHLREEEAVLLHQPTVEISNSERAEVASYLEGAYQQESLNFPYTPPIYQAEVAVWGAEIVYLAAQLILYRKHHPAELPKLLPTYRHLVTPDTALSADLCLRFLPDLLLQLRLIDLEDPLIPLLEELLLKWHFSGIAYTHCRQSRDLSWVSAHPCVQQLYADRIITHKRLDLASKPELRPTVAASLGNYGTELWEEFELANATDQ